MFVLNIYCLRTNPESTRAKPQVSASHLIKACAAVRSVLNFQRFIFQRNNLHHKTIIQPAMSKHGANKRRLIILSYSRRCTNNSLQSLGIYQKRSRAGSALQQQVGKLNRALSTSVLVSVLRFQISADVLHLLQRSNDNFFTASRERWLPKALRFSLSRYSPYSYQPPSYILPRYIIKQNKINT